jgi:Phytanoyl-CoA dioxygenase (PhyH)
LRRGARGLREPQLLQSMYIFKQPRTGGEVAWHADHTYLWTEPPSVVGIWFAIDRTAACLPDNWLKRPTLPLRSFTY